MEADNHSTSRRAVLVGTIVAGMAIAASAQGLDPRFTPRRSYTPGEVWLDTAGKPIQAHGGSIIQVGDRY